MAQKCVVLTRTTKSLKTRLQALKTLKGATDNAVAKTLGADKFAEGQIVKAVGMTPG